MERPFSLASAANCWWVCLETLTLTLPTGMVIGILPSFNSAFSIPECISGCNIFCIQKCIDMSFIPEKRFVTIKRSKPGYSLPMDSAQRCPFGIGPEVKYNVLIGQTGRRDRVGRRYCVNL